MVLTPYYRSLIRSAPFVPLCILLSLSLHGQNNSLFEPYSAQLRANEQAIVTKLNDRHSTVRTRLVKVNEEAFTMDLVQAKLFEDVAYDIPRSDIGRTGIALPSWTGVQQDKLCSAAFVIYGKRISGHITSVDGNFEIIPLDTSGTHLIVEHDDRSFEGCGDPVSTATVDPPDSKPGHTRDAARTPGDNECNIRVIVAYTARARDSTLAVYNRTMIEHVSLAVLETNQGYANSNADQRIELACLYLTEDDETPDSQEDVIDLRDTTDGKWDEIHMYRNMYQADMACLVTGGLYEGICGRAYGFGYTQQTDMFQVSEFNCIVGNYTFAHEFGHLQGCRHDIDINTSPFAYGHGYNQGSVFRTIMAVCCNPVRVNYWSNPFIFYPGAGPMGSLNFSNNTLALNNSYDTVMMHRITPMASTTGDMIGDDEMSHTRTIDVINAADTAMVGGQLQLNASERIRLAPGFRSMNGSKTTIRIAETGCQDN